MTNKKIKELERERDNFKAHLDIALKKEDRLRAEVAKLEGVRLALLDGQEGLKRQTVRIRRALTDGVEDGVDTEEIARRVRCERDALKAKTVEDLERELREAVAESADLAAAVVEANAKANQADANQAEAWTLANARVAARVAVAKKALRCLRFCVGVPDVDGD